MSVDRYLLDLERFVRADWNSLVSIRDTAGPQGHCGVPTALLGFSVLDAMAFLVVGTKLDDTLGSSLGALVTGDNKTLFPSLVRIAPFADILIPVFRNGISHRFYPKACGIARGIATDPILVENTTGSYVLNPDALVHTMLEFINELRLYIARPTSIPLELLEARLSAMIAHDHMTFQLAKCSTRRLAAVRTHGPIVTTPSGMGTTTTPPITAGP